MEATTGPALVISGAEVEVISGAEVAVLGRQLAEAIQRGWGVRQAAPPRELLDFAVAVNRAAASAVSGHQGWSAGAAETRKRPGGAVLTAWAQPDTFSVAQAAAMAKVSERRIRQLAQHGFIEVRAGARPIRVYADSLTAWLESRRRRETHPKAA